eukprot:TRINITY_DN2852_c0_g1_i1.p1 TRINITY_DN2852_c0_g1~~TRINITY_DN2852_c0_g1_i1.p1  ORF type:complete len:647 (+),score=41.99 TRINITY_DN2852_c0_g1_i1:107-2047(+)
MAFTGSARMRCVKISLLLTQIHTVVSLENVSNASRNVSNASRNVSNASRSVSNVSSPYDLGFEFMLNWSSAPLAALVERSQLPLRTWQQRIVDNRRERVKWACVNIAGAHMEQHVIFGLNRMRLASMVAIIVGQGFNCVRLAYSTQGVIENPVVLDRYVSANPEFKGGKRMLDLFDATIEAMTKAKLMVIINNHISKSGWCCRFDSEEGLWYTPEYSEKDWIDALLNLAERYKSNPYVVAYDIRNEPHDYNGVSLTWGDGDPKRDLAAAMKRAGDAILAIQPNVLIVIEPPCLSKDLRPLKSHQIELSQPNRVVYQVHAYVFFQIYSLIYDQVVSYHATRFAARSTFLLVFLAIVANLYLSGERWIFLEVRNIRPPPGFWMLTAGGWMTLLSFLLFLVSLALYIAAAVTGCRIGADIEHRPQILASTGAFAVSAIVLMRGLLVYRRGRQRAPCHHSHEGLDTDGCDVTTAQKATSAVWSRRHGCRVQCGICSVLGLLLAVAIYLCTCIFSTYAWFEYSHDAMWGFAMVPGHKYTAPVMVGEFGISAPGTYWNHLIRYMAERDIDYAVWVLNPTKPLTQVYRIGQGWVTPKKVIDVTEPYGIMDNDWYSIRNPWILLDLQGIQVTPSSYAPKWRQCSYEFDGPECGG